MKTVIAALRFKTGETGGRVPAGPAYSTVARFRDRDGDWLDQTWSIVAEFTGPADKHGCRTARLRFLVEAAPHDLLFLHNRFELFEGPHQVGDGEVISESAVESAQVRRPA